MRAIQRPWPRLATNLNDLENLSDHIHYYSTSQDSLARVRPRFFDQVGHQATNASIGSKHFFTK